MGAPSGLVRTCPVSANQTWDGDSTLTFAKTFSSSILQPVRFGMYDLRHAWIDTGRGVLLFWIFLIAPLPAKPQEAKSGTLGQPATWAQTELQSTSFAWPASCNTASGIYLRQLNGTQSWTYAPITQLLPNGNTRKIDLGAATNFGESVLGVAFDSDGQGNVYAAIQIGRAIQWYIAKYDNAGRFIRKLTLPGRLVP